MSYINLKLLKNQQLLAIVIVIVAVVLSNVSGVLTEAIFGAVVIGATFNARGNRIRPWGLLAINSMCFIAIIGTAAKVVYNLEFSLYQILRSSIWVIFYCYLLIVGNKVFTKLTISDLMAIYNILRKVIISFAILVVVDIVIGTQISPATIRLTGSLITDQRIYIVGSSVLPSLLLLYLLRADVLPVLATLILIGVTQGKVMLVAIPIAIFTLMLYKQKKGILVLILMIPLAAIFPYDRFLDFIEAGGDINRSVQINDAVVAYSADFISLIFGIGHGTPFSEGYAQYGQISEDKINQFENSRFDLENGYFYLPLRFGVFGVLIFLILSYRAIPNKKIRFAFIMNMLVFSTASSYFATPGGIFFVCGFLFTYAILGAEKNARYLTINNA